MFIAWLPLLTKEFTQKSYTIAMNLKTREHGSQSQCSHKIKRCEPKWLSYLSDQQNGIAIAIRRPRNLIHTREYD